ncbi:hypothetical protein MRX96_024844 [Rhipicephalus microplus]
MWRGRSSHANHRALHPDPRTAAGNPGRTPAVYVNWSAWSCFLAAPSDRMQPYCTPALQTEWQWQLFVREVLCNTYAQLGLSHVSPEHMLFSSANVATLLRAFHALLDVFSDADLFTHL